MVINQLWIEEEKIIRGLVGDGCVENIESRRWQVGVLEWVGGEVG